VKKTCLVLVILAAGVPLCACSAPPGGGGAAIAAEAAATVAPIDDGARAQRLAQRVADTLQACSYDGASVEVRPGGDAPRDCRDMIARVMEFTGLPQNFDVVEADVPNAAAVIVLDDQRIPRRMIAFNGRFMEQVRRQTDGNPWSPVSIMAHEVAHHLAGHTIVPGGSQPPIELEADKFSGFVLYKMGASRDDSAAALKALVPETAPPGSTHPDRGRRVAALAEGWNQACSQVGRTDCTNGLPAGGVSPVPQSTMQQTSSSAALAPAPARRSPLAAAVGVPGEPAATPVAMRPPAPSSTSIPNKGTQFVYDEYGWLDAGIVADHERQLRDHARESGVEIVTLLVRDLHGMSADAYAWSMLRQLRVGKLDVGNGAVLVVAPDQAQVGAALGPGVALEIGNQDKAAALRNWLETAWPLCRRAAACGNWTENLLGAADHIRRDTRHWDWSIRYQDLASLQRQVAEESESGVPPQDSQAWRRIVAFGGTVEDVAPQPGGATGFVNAAKLGGGRYRAIAVRSTEGMKVMLYLDPRVEALMPAGALRSGQRYAFVGREAGVSRNRRDTHAIDLLSYMETR
jgi:hypothetical protein